MFGNRRTLAGVSPACACFWTLFVCLTSAVCAENAAQIAGENLIGSKIVLPEAAAGHRAILDRLGNPELLPHQGTLRGSRGDGRGYKNMRYILLKAKRMTATNTEYVAFRQIKKAA